MGFGCDLISRFSKGSGNGTGNRNEGVSNKGCPPGRQGYIGIMRGLLGCVLTIV